MQMQEISQAERIIVCFSGGIDSHAMLIEQAALHPAKVIAVFNDTGDDHSPSNRLVDWKGTEEFVKAECAALGVPLIITRPKRDILTMATDRGMFASPSIRQCTSDLKRGPTDKALRRLANGKLLLITDSRLEFYGNFPSSLCNNLVVLTGELAEESPARAKKPQIETRKGVQAIGRTALHIRPQLHKTKTDEILYIWQNGRDIAPTYYAGWDRLSCRFCFFLTFERQILSFIAYPNEAAEFVRAEEKIKFPVNLDYEHAGYKGYRAVWDFVYGAHSYEVGADLADLEPLSRAVKVQKKLETDALKIIEQIKQGKKVGWQRTCSTAKDNLN
jgi:3'-phosphoadenosine 5'-phosphosulfate sulfotransferase (PAPS reductase)/FAD synthetase